MPRGQQEAEMSRVRAASAPSPFGHGNQTVVDQTVRKAHQLMPDQFVLSGGFDGVIPAHILDKVRKELVPDAGAITAKLHKINVYENGGFFTDHKDTPRSETHFGSLVLLLPAFHTGGALSVDHGGESKAFDWASSAARDFTPFSYGWGADRAAKEAAHTPSATLRFAAFFGDATHRVKPVSAGARVTIAYELYRDGLPDPNADALLLRAERCRAAFAALARSPSFMATGGAIGFECCHLYEEKELTAAEKTLAASTSATASARKIKGLKNEDSVLAVAAAAGGWTWTRFACCPTTKATPRVSTCSTSCRRPPRALASCGPATAAA
jgi:predicted 2-oxoglutarate/Fe(II)-dependent dioxygenase YbiX